MPRMYVELLLDSVGYSGDNIGSGFDFAISSPSLTRDPVVIPKEVPFDPKSPTIFKNKVKVVDRVVALPDGPSSLQVKVKVVEKDEIPDEGSGSGEVKVLPEGTGNGFVGVEVKGKGGRDEKKTGRLRIGFLLVADGSPERIAKVCGMITPVVDRYGGAVKDRLQAVLLRIAWHESKRLQVRTQENGGPARGVFQMQADGAVSALTRMGADTDIAAYSDFASTGGFPDLITLDDTVAALAERVKQGMVSFGDNPIGAALERSDRCAALAAIYALRPYEASLPAVTNIAATAEFWAKNWRRKSTAAANKLFRDEAERLDRIRRQLPLSDCGLPA